jgi:hypothetical protein
MVRDGRDVAASLKGMWWGPGTMRGGIRWWERRLRAADAGVAALAPDQLLTLELEDLVVRDRERSYARLLEFLEVEDERRMRRQFDKRLVPDNANIGRWRRDLPPWRRRRIDRAYARALARMHATGVASAPRLVDEEDLP